MSTETDILAGRINAAIEEWDSSKPGELAAHVATHVASELTDAGYRKPRQVTTPDELAALPDMTVVRSSKGSIVNLVGGRAYVFGTEGSAPASTLALPVTVLHEGTL